MSKKKKAIKGTFAEIVKALMERDGLTQQQFAENNGVSQSTVAKWLAGTLPNTVNLTNFAQANSNSESYFLIAGEPTLEGKPLFKMEGETDPYEKQLGISLKIPVDKVSASVKLAELKPQLPTLLERLKKATEQHGKKTVLADFLGVPLASVSQWLSGDREPGGETTLRMLQWVEQQERQK